MLLNGLKRRPCRDDGDGEFVRFIARARKADRDCNIESPASHYAIMRRAYPYRGENSEPGKDIVSLTPRPGIREQNRPVPDSCTAANNRTMAKGRAR